ncbi:MAG: hypothetical protein LC798_04005 [Chloroflexi bacterium]|nr:hypothetical protein [Chloroflexota bacterium]
MLAPGQNRSPRHHAVRPQLRAIEQTDRRSQARPHHDEFLAAEPAQLVGSRLRTATPSLQALLGPLVARRVPCTVIVEAKDRLAALREALSQNAERAVRAPVLVTDWWEHEYAGLTETGCGMRHPPEQWALRRAEPTSDGS